ncbi:unnamed protein product [Gongylonema pulchrum]|uniref:Uncharacterized protein n=1 Tax=Gongylonema pulchrum TaxID=637853 RepID=A0A183EVH3_9BILA|nr:unnamed protein product [Gongylonema pulchrum]
MEITTAPNLPASDSGNAGVSANNRSTESAMEITTAPNLPASDSGNAGVSANNRCTESDAVDETRGSFSVNISRLSRQLYRWMSMLDDDGGDIIGPARKHAVDETRGSFSVNISRLSRQLYRWMSMLDDDGGDIIGPARKRKCFFRYIVQHALLCMLCHFERYFL